MRIVAGVWRGKVLRAPAGVATRPTSVRLRQAVFDMLMHAAWFGAARMRGAAVADVFAGSGAMGLEALSRGAASCVFVERDAAALAAIRANIAACGAGDRARVLAIDAAGAWPGGAACDLMFLDPPYGAGLVPVAVARAAAAGWVGPGTVILAEAEAEVVVPGFAALAARAHGAGCVTVLASGP